MPKMPPKDGKTKDQMWKEFGRWLNATDVTGKNRGDNRGKTAASRAATLKKNMTSPAYPPAAPKRPVRGGGSLQGDLAKFGAQIKRNKSATSSKAKQISKKMGKGY